MTLEPLLGSIALYRADVSWDTSSELSEALGRWVQGYVLGGGAVSYEQGTPVIKASL